MPITADSIVTRTHGLMSTALDRDLVLLNPSRDNYVGLDEIGQRIWELLTVPRNVGDLCQQVAQEFDGDSRQIAADVMMFLNELSAEALVHVAKT